MVLESGNSKGRLNNLASVRAFLLGYYMAEASNDETANKSERAHFLNKATFVIIH